MLKQRFNYKENVCRAFFTRGVFIPIKEKIDLRMFCDGPYDLDEKSINETIQAFRRRKNE